VYERSSNQHRILAEAIVASFALKKPTPVIKISRDSAQLYLYIPESDVLLEGAPIYLVTEDELNLSGVLFLWLILNYNTFKEDLSRTIKCGMPVSNFKTLVGDKLDLYERSVHLGGCKRKSAKKLQTLDYFYKLESAINFSVK
jgi:hypothetical protein